MIFGSLSDITMAMHRRLYRTSTTYTVWCKRAYE